MTPTILTSLANQVSNIEFSDKRRKDAAHTYLMNLIIMRRDKKLGDIHEMAELVGNHVRVNFLGTATDQSESDWVRRYGIEKGSKALIELANHIINLRDADKAAKGVTAFNNADKPLKDATAKLGLDEAIETLTKIAEDTKSAPEVRKDAIANVGLLFIAAQRAEYKIDRAPYNERFNVISTTATDDHVAGYAMQFGIG